MHKSEFESVRGAMIAHTVRDMAHESDMAYVADIVATMIEEMTLENGVMIYANDSATGVTCRLDVKNGVATANTDAERVNDCGTVVTRDLGHVFDVAEVTDFFREFVAEHMC